MTSDNFNFEQLQLVSCLSEAGSYFPLISDVYTWVVVGFRIIGSPQSGVDLEFIQHVTSLS